MNDIKRLLLVGDGYVLTEHRTGGLVRYAHHMARVEQLEAEIAKLRETVEWLGRKSLMDKGMEP